MPESTPPTTLINGGWIVAFDGERHRILRDGVVVYRGDTVIHVGKAYEGAVDHAIDARDFEAVNTRDVFNAATLGGARALGREDLGRLAPGARADILIVDFQRARVGPFLDPIKALIQCCDGEVIDTVIVAGRIRVENGRVLAWDSEELLEGVRRSCANAWDHFADYWPDNEPIEAVFPSAFERWEE